MRVLIQRLDSRLCFREPDDWVADVGQATDYAETTLALRKGVEFRRQKLRVEILMVFEERRYDIRLPVLLHDDKPDVDGLTEGGC
jgi:hypothetical protein